MDFLGGISFGDCFTQFKSSGAGAQKGGPATRPGGEKAVKRGGRMGGRGNETPSLTRHHLPLHGSPHLGPPNPSQARVCVYYTSQETEVPAR